MSRVNGLPRRRRMKAFSVQARGNLGPCLTGASQFHNAFHQRLVIPQSLIAGQRPASLAMANEATSPMKFEIDDLMVGRGINDHLFEQMTDDRLAVFR